MKFDVKNFEKLIDGDLEKVKPEGGEFMAYEAVKQLLGGGLYLINKLVKRYTKMPSLFHWVWLSALHDIFIDRAKALHAASVDGKEAIYTLRIIPDEQGKPAIEVNLSLLAPNADGSVTITHKESYYPHRFVHRALAWYDTRKNIGTDIAKLWVMMNRTPDPKATPKAP